MTFPISNISYDFLFWIVPYQKKNQPIRNWFKHNVSRPLVWRIAIMSCIGCSIIRVFIAFVYLYIGLNFWSSKKNLERSNRFNLVSPSHSISWWLWGRCVPYNEVNAPINRARIIASIFQNCVAIMFWVRQLCIGSILFPSSNCRTRMMTPNQKTSRCAHLIIE